MLDQKVTMVHAMMLICFANKTMTSQKIALVESYAKALPEFYGHDFQRYYKAAKEVASGAGGSLDRAVDSLSRIKSKELRLKTFLCCLELAYADGEPCDGEGSLLDAMQKVLDVTSEHARAMREVVAMKFKSLAFVA
ncbi:hypothetical protein ACFYW6_37865 [Streptomyces sp. NPDC002659]|uniref:hypothetical protein n=1 Tax=Streptomyces sp. NPDC002659 TaxID=3364656 RepID=UPI0036BECC03